MGQDLRESMRIIYFSQDYTPHDHRFLTKLSQSGHEIHYLRYETNPTPLETRPVPSGIKIVDWQGNTTFRTQMWGKFSLYREFRGILSDIEPDLVHAGPVQTCGYFTALSGFRPSLIMSWGSDILQKAESSLIQRWITKFTINRADMIACDCKSVQDKIIQLSGYPREKTVVFPWGIDLQRFNPDNSESGLKSKLGWEGKKLVISTRSFEGIYGTDILLKAMKMVIRKNRNIRFVIVGDGSMRSQVMEYIDKHDLGHAVHLAGRVSNEVLPNYLNEADLYLSCSLSDGSSVSLLEAMACGLPVIVTDIPSNHEWVTHGVNGWLAAAGNSDAVASAIIGALDGSIDTSAMSQTNIDVTGRRADWEINSDLLLEAYQKILN